MFRDSFLLTSRLTGYLSPEGPAVYVSSAREVRKKAGCERRQQEQLGTEEQGWNGICRGRLDGIISKQECTGEEN